MLLLTVMALEVGLCSGWARATDLRSLPWESYAESTSWACHRLGWMRDRNKGW